MASIIWGKIRDAVRRLSAFARRREEMRGYVATHRFSMGGGDTETIAITNPAGSGVVADIERFVISSQFRGQFDILDTFSAAPSGGTEVVIDNLVMDTDGSEGPEDDGSMSVVHSPSFTATGSSHFEGTIPSGGGSGGSSTTGGEGTASEPLIEPGRSAVIEIENDSNNTRPATVGYVYTELPYRP